MFLRDLSDCLSYPSNVPTDNPSKHSIYNIIKLWIVDFQSINSTCICYKELRDQLWTLFSLLWTIFLASPVDCLFGISVLKDQTVFIDIGLSVAFKGYNLFIQKLYSKHWMGQSCALFSYSISMSLKLSATLLNRGIYLYFIQKFYFSKFDGVVCSLLLHGTETDIIRMSL